MIRETVSSFAADVIGPRVRDMDTASAMDPTVISALFEHGLMGVEAPEDLGGSGLNFMSACIVVEEIAKVDPAVAVLVDIQNTLINNMLRFWGSKELQDKYFPKLCSGSVASFCLSEVGSGSDAFSLSTKATASPDGSYYTIEGEKQWISNAKEADIFFVFANVDPSKGYKGITCFVVEKGFGGVHVGPKEDKLGIRASSTCPVTFSDCEVPKENILGEVRASRCWLWLLLFSSVQFCSASVVMPVLLSALSCVPSFPRAAPSPVCYRPVYDRVTVSRLPLPRLAVSRRPV